MASGLTEGYASAEIDRPPSLSDVMVLCRQMQDAVVDVCSAWYGFQTGCEMPVAQKDVAQETFRIDHLMASMRGQLGELISLSAAIRSRT